MKQNLEREWDMLDRIAQEDLKAFQILIATEDVALPMACFHGQQAVEKYLKAVLSRKDIAFPFTHNLLKLHALFEANGIKLPVSVELLEKLNPFAVKQRYDMPPDIHVTREEAQHIVLTVVDWCKKQLHD